MMWELATSLAQKLASALSTGFGSASPTFFMGRHARLRSGSPSVILALRRAGRNVLHILSLTPSNFCPTSLTNHCTKVHSDWMDFCRPAFADCG
jgi:hypothetical protein